ncbi:RNA-directed DNA polymerase [Candidatus Uhrbacteria bacterium]|nr:RNA-directed DNA polymerase [Candidatus Uhrbacteria bacterium]
MPIGNLTSQLFANVYMSPFDHYVKEILRVKYYLRYTDDFIILHDDPVALVSLLPSMRFFLQERLALDLHPRKIELRKLKQGIDFLGYVTLSHYRRLRTKTKDRAFRRIETDGLSNERLQSYLGLLSHCEGYWIKQRLRELYVMEQKNKIARNHSLAFSSNGFHHSA